ncbi:MAG: dihydrofolate reductase [Armatimonadetes bacterium 55-13]|nr:dihydrofolate reductase family protein [Armatimonadota bacterium]OJU63195.1 MAG: dihydrofolate reductase [Armatimonadetes bacterium 55-13]
MRKIIVAEMITLDGVMQAPGSPEEDPSGDFQLGGWTAPCGDELGLEVLKKQMEPADYLLGGKTFRIWEPYWPNHADFWPGINSGTKYVLSRTQSKSDWQNTVFLTDLAEIEKLKASDGPDLQVWGSSELVQLLLMHDLVDELWLKTYPVILGAGKKVFGQDSIPTAFSLVESVVTSKGVVLATYRRSGRPATGRVGE